MRSVTVDTQGLGFALKLVGIIGGVLLLWYAWLPAYELAFSEGIAQETVLSAVAQSDPKVRSDAIERLHSIVQQEADPDASVYDLEDSRPTHGEYVWVDVETKSVSFYKDEQEIFSASVVSMPATDSPDALQAGSYTVSDTTDGRVSTVTMTRFPHYIPFGDQFAFHGLPTDVHGNATSEQHMAGSVEMNDADAAQLASLVSAGTSVFVEAYGTKDVSKEKIIFTVSSSDLPATTASSYVLRDLESKQTYIVKNGDDQHPIASITKLVTAAVASDVIGHGEEVRAPNGEYFVLGDLYYPLLLRSDNAVAHRIAIHGGSDRFIAHMNTYVAAHQMTKSAFADASGLSPKNVSSANDLALLAQHLYRDKKYILDITSEADMTITSLSGTSWQVENQNKLSSDPLFRGGKLGYTDEAQQTSLAIFNVPVAGETRPVAVVILGSKDWKQDTRTLLKWLVDVSHT